MKRFIVVIFTVLLGLALVGCSTSATKTRSSGTEVPVKITVGSSTKTYEVVKGSTLLALVKNKLHANETKGFINSIDGLASNPTKKLYLMFKVNGQLSNVGAADVKLKDGDHIEFYLSKY